MQKDGLPKFTSNYKPTGYRSVGSPRTRQFPEQAVEPSPRSGVNDDDELTESRLFASRRLFGSLHTDSYMYNNIKASVAPYKLQAVGVEASGEYYTGRFVQVSL